MADLKEIGKQAKAARYILAGLDTDTKNKALFTAAECLEADAADILAENAKDLEAGRSRSMPEGLLDRLSLTQKRISDMAEGLRQVAALPDPVGEILDTFTRPNGLVISKRRVPLGVIGIIYESRPNVTADAFGLCFKAGNAAILKGGSDALLQDRHEKEYILNEFIPYLNLHVTLSEIEQSVSEKLGETDELTLERSEQFAALQQNVRTVRAMLNQGNYDFSVAQINELSPKFAEWMRQISKKSIQQSSENTLTKEEIIHDFEQIATQNRAEIRQEQHEEFEITML